MKNTGLICLLTCLCLAHGMRSSHAANLQGRLGLGATQQLKNGLPAISLKIQRSPVYALGALLAVKFSDQENGYGAGLKIYRIIFDEPQLNFYLAGTAAILNQEIGGVASNGFQFDGAFGSEFHFTGIESLGFSFEFGLSANNINENFSIEIFGDHFITAAIHFYL